VRKDMGVGVQSLGFRIRVSEGRATKSSRICAQDVVCVCVHLRAYRSVCARACVPEWAYS